MWYASFFCGLFTNDHEIYMYLLSSKTVSRKDYKIKYKIYMVKFTKSDHLFSASTCFEAKPEMNIT